MNDTHERLCRLFGELGVNTEAGFGRAEIDAYTAGIDVIKSAVSHDVKRLLINDEDADLSKYLELINIKPNINEGKAKQIEMIKKHFSLPWGFFDVSLFNYYFDRILGCDWLIKNGDMHILNGKTGGARQIAEFLRNVAPFNLTLVFSGDGMTFNEWRNLNFNWSKLDSFGMPFSLIDEWEV